MPFPVGPAAEAGRCWWSASRYSTPAVSSMTRWLSSASPWKKSSFQGLQTCTCAPGGPRPRAAAPSPQHPGSSSPAQSLLPSGPTRLPPEKALCVLLHFLGLGKTGQVCVFFQTTQSLSWLLLCPPPNQSVPWICQAIPSPFYGHHLGCCCAWLIVLLLMWLLLPMHPLKGLPPVSSPSSLTEKLSGLSRFLFLFAPALFGE